MTELHDLTALEQGAAVRRGETSTAELVEHYLDRIARLDDVGAFVTVTADQARARGAALPASDSPLWGVPTAVKDLNTTAGVRTTFGSAAYEDFVPETSDGVVTSLEAAGLVSLGKTATPSRLALLHRARGPAAGRDALGPQPDGRGLLGGAAAAVAAGLVSVAQGSDGGAHPDPGLVLRAGRPQADPGPDQRRPMYGDPVGLATAGPIARTVRDAAALLDVLAGHRPGDPSWAPEPSGTFLAACDRPPGRLRVARFVAPMIADVPVDAECVRAWDDAARLLEGMGHDVEDVAVPLPAEAVATFETCWAVLTALSPVPPGREDRIRPLTRWLADRGRAVSGPELGLAIGALRRYAAGALEALAAYDVVLTPTLAAPPLPVGALRDDDDPAADFEAQKAFTPWTSGWNVTGMPAVSLPLHQTPEGLPVGVMLASRPAEEELLLAVSAQVEAAAPWAHRHPPGW